MGFKEAPPTKKPSTSGNSPRASGQRLRSKASGAPWFFSVLVGWLGAKARRKPVKNQPCPVNSIQMAFKQQPWRFAEELEAIKSHRLRPFEPFFFLKKNIPGTGLSSVLLKGLWIDIVKILCFKIRPSIKNTPLAKFECFLKPCINLLNRF